MVVHSMARRLAAAFVSIAGARTNHTCNLQQWECQVLQHSEPLAARKSKRLMIYYAICVQFAN